MNRISDMTSVNTSPLEEGEGGYKDYGRLRRPRNVQGVRSAKEAAAWRAQLLQEFRQLSVRMHDPALSEEQLAEENARLNEMWREKARWDKQLARLARGNAGGSKGQQTTADRVLLAGARKILGKWYFGRAVELPEVSEYIAEQKRKERLARVAYSVDVKRVPGARDTASPQHKLYYATEQSQSVLRSQEHWTELLQRADNAPKTESAQQCEMPKGPPPTQQQMEQYLVQRRKKDLLAKLDV